MNKLDDLLNEFDDKSKQGKEKLKKLNEEQKAKKEAFNSSFSAVMNNTIRPIMTEHLKKIRNHGHIAKIDTNDSKHIQYLHESYLINRGQGGQYAHISIVGNYDHQKVFIYTEYSEGSSSKKIENQYDLSEVTDGLILDIVTNAVSKILK